MFLKKIIISGFKSFADKVVLTFDKGITGVVGPNGSGKSNIIDSVRWVMGEQNAKNLRGEKATDIIFAGSERRKALGMAEVSLVFDNSDDSAFCPAEYRHEPEIVLTRRMYADGQREYLINKKPCRLKDIVGFFASTGLGGRSYSMIQQGQVDRILNAKPEDVREILEEAAGTVVYKKRKGEAEKKLEQTQLNLSRIEDILNEVEKTLLGLEDQVEKAKEWQELSDKLRVEEMSLFAHNYHHFKEQQDKIQAEVAASTENEAQTLADMAGFESRHAELQGQLDEADPDLQILQEAIAVIREKISGTESSMKSAATRIDAGERRLKDLSEELAEDDANLRVLESQVENSRSEVANADSVAEKLNEAIESFEHEVENANEAAQVYQSRMDEFEDETRNLERLIESNKLRGEGLDKDLERIAREAAEETARLETLRADIVGVAEDLKAAEAKAGQTQAGLDQEIREKHDREAAVANSYARIKQANVRRDELKEKYHQNKARYTSLQEIEAGATDVAGALAKLKEAAPQTEGLVKGLVADFISFNDKAKELPQKAKAAFERWSERVIVDSLGSFNDLVRTAHQHETGAMPVLVLSQCEAIDSAAATAWAEDFGAEPLRQYLKVERNAPANIDALLDRLYLLPALSLDDDLVKAMPTGLLTFTSQGVSFAAGKDGSGAGEFVVGGKAAPGLLTRKTQLEELAKDLKGIESDLAKAQSEIDELDFQINSDRQIVADIDQKLQQQNRSVLEVMTALQSVQQLYDRKHELIAAAEAALQKHNDQTARLTDERETLAKNRFALGRELSAAQEELKRIEEESESLIERREELRRLHEGKKLDLAKSSARAQALRDSYLTTKAQLELLQNKLARRYDERQRLEQDVVQARAEEIQAKASIEGLLAERERQQKEYAAKREEHAGVLEELRVLDNKLRDLRDRQSVLQRGLADKNLQLERLRMVILGNVEQALEKYKIELATYEFEREENFNPENRSRSVQRLRAKIEGMGAINMMALKEFDEKTARRDFIIKQRDEVVSSMDLLAAAIGEIEETSLRKFMEVFERINFEFGQLFPILFPTGEGKLELTNPENPLIGGVEILCRLPGKSQKPMSLFSGGEKALTAMALIFGMLRTKPTPYCFLDEVDAPLDEANVGRYNRVLEALSSQFQFIVITHNRRTMEVLDTLYGITMQEPGVSKVVGVDMQKDLPPHLRKAFKDETGKLTQPTPPRAQARAVEGASAQ
jgi:chromosome segregation protein